VEYPICGTGIFGHGYFAAEVLASSALTRYNGLMNMKRLFGAFIAAFILAFSFEWLLHGIILRGSLPRDRNARAQGQVQRTVNLLAPVGAVAERGARYEPTYHYES
jgi:hypothetical protein